MRSVKEDRVGRALHRWQARLKSWIGRGTQGQQASTLVYYQGTGVLKLAQVKGILTLGNHRPLFYDCRRSQKCILEPYRLTSRFHSKIGLTKPKLVLNLDVNVWGCNMRFWNLQTS